MPLYVMTLHTWPPKSAKHSHRPVLIVHQKILHDIFNILPQEALTHVIQSLGLPCLATRVGQAETLAPLEITLQNDGHSWVSMRLFPEVILHKLGVWQVGCFVILIPAAGRPKCLVDASLGAWCVCWI